MVFLLFLLKSRIRFAQDEYCVAGTHTSPPGSCPVQLKFDLPATEEAVWGSWVLSGPIRGISVMAVIELNLTHDFIFTTVNTYFPASLKCSEN